MKWILLSFTLLGACMSTLAQNWTVSGQVKDAFTNVPLELANVLVYGETNGGITNEEGKFVIKGIDQEFIQLQISVVGYQVKLTEMIHLSAIRNNFVEILLEPAIETLQEVKVKSRANPLKSEAPLSIRRIGIDQIEKSAGANRDISRILQSYPGVGTGVSFRNDLFVRGGGPSENRFYLDGIEIPNLNHFATQGATGGPVGILNVDLIREVDFYSSTFPVTRGNALSSVFEFKQINVNDTVPHFKFSVGASEMSLTTTTPLGEKTGLVASVRRSYLQFLFDALGLPFLPTFNDFQMKLRTRINPKNELTFIGVGAIDRFRLNKDADPTEENKYILGYLPVNNQWNYTLGTIYKHYFENSFVSIFLSRNHLNNEAVKYQDNIKTRENLQINYKSDEEENKWRMEYKTRSALFTFLAGAGAEYVRYYNSTFNIQFVDNELSLIDYQSKLDFLKWSLFSSLSYAFMDGQLTMNAGLRLDANSYSKSMNNLLEQLSPRLSLSYQWSPTVSFNANVGRYYQLPAYTMLGYRDNEGTLLNKENKITYIRSDHWVAGFDFRLKEGLNLTLEAFYKKYNNYPFSVEDSVAMASKGADFGVYGDEEVVPDSEGRSYGSELLLEYKSTKQFRLTGAYTYVRSEFTDINDRFIPSSWDSRHLLTLTANKTLNKYWDIAFKWRYSGGLPYTPYDQNKSELVQAWNAQNQQYLNYAEFNTKRLSSFHQLDMRIDKTYYFKRMTLGIYIDVQNLYNRKAFSPPELIQQLDANNSPIIKDVNVPEEEQRYQLKELSTSSGTVLPTIGLMLEF